MSESSTLPIEGRPFGIRFESIGGLGAAAAAEALARAAALRMGLDATQFSSRTPERKGAALRAFVRLAPADRAIRSGAPLEMPDAIVAFHPALLRDPATFGGLRERGTFVYAAPARSVPEELATLPRSARAIRVDAFGIAAKEKCGPEAPLLGALCAALGFLDADAVLDALVAECAADAAGAMRNAFGRGAKESETLKDAGKAEGGLPVVRAKPAWGFDTQPAGGVLAAPGNTIWNDVSAARSGFLPVFNRERCIHCALCDLVCPDMCLVWQDGEPGGRFARELTGVDYRYCKGCLRCVETCPASCMTKKAETPGLAERLAVPLYPDLVA